MNCIPAEYIEQIYTLWSQQPTPFHNFFAPFQLFFYYFFFFYPKTIIFDWKTSTVALCYTTRIDTGLGFPPPGDITPAPNFWYSCNKNDGNWRGRRKSSTEIGRHSYWILDENMMNCFVQHNKILMNYLSRTTVSMACKSHHNLYLSYLTGAFLLTLAVSSILGGGGG